jgi:hypothetical protein
MRRLIMLCVVMAIPAWGAPTNQATPTSFSLSLNSNGVIKAPANFLATNNIATNAAVTSATNRIAVIEGRTQVWNQASTDASWWTNLWNGSPGYGTKWILLTNGMADWNLAKTNAAYATNGMAAWWLAYTNAATAFTNAANWMNWAAANTGKLVNVNSELRYSAYAVSTYEIMVRAYGTGITATVSGSLVTMSIPSGTMLLSARIRWPADSGSGGFTLVLGTNDMANTSLPNRWGAVFSAYREDTGAFLPTASCRLDIANHDRLIIGGLITTPGVVNHCMMEF